MDSESVLFELSFFSHPDSSTFYLFVGFHYTLNQYGDWVRPIQLQCQYSTVKCVIQLHETFSHVNRVWGMDTSRSMCNQSS